MSTTDPNRTGRTERPGGGTPRPSTPVVAIIIAAVAGLLGLLILRNVKDGSSGASAKTTTTSTTTTPSTSLFDTTIPGTTVPIIQRTGATVVVANASAQSGAAGALSSLLKKQGYTMGKAVTAVSGTKLDITQVLHADNRHSF